MNPPHGIIVHMYAITFVHARANKVYRTCVSGSTSGVSLGAFNTLGGIPRGLQHLRGAPLVDPSTLSMVTLQSQEIWQHLLGFTSPATTRVASRLPQPRQLRPHHQASAAYRRQGCVAEDRRDPAGASGGQGKRWRRGRRAKLQESRE